MKTHEQILSMMAKSHAQAPMQFNALLEKSGLKPDTLNMVLDQMYAAHHINQATVTRSGVEQREVWPTGMANQLNAYADPSKRVAPTPLPRRNEAPAIQPKDIAMNTNQREKKPKALTILKYIEANPVCNSAQISHATGIVSPRSYIKAHISRGAVIVAGENRKDIKMQLAAGCTAEAIYGNGYNKAKPAPSAALLAEVQAAHGCTEFSESTKESGLPALVLEEPAPIYEIPAFLRKSEVANIPAFLKSQPIDVDLAKPDAITQAIETLFNLPPVLAGIENDAITQAVETLFNLLPPASAIIIGRNDGVLEIDIEADVFGKSIAKTVALHQVAETLTALHIVTVEME